jgi:hypothetical protein
VNPIDAVEILRQPVAEEALLLRVSLVCGLTALHLKIFLARQLRERLPQGNPAIPSARCGVAFASSTDIEGVLETTQGRTTR